MKNVKTEFLFQKDSYLKEFEAKVVAIVENKVFLDKTAFHPGPSGGLDTDTGWLILPNGEKLEVEAVREEDRGVAHLVKGDVSALAPGITVKGVINWERRHRMMRLHTASHVIAALLYEKYGARVTGGHIGPEVARDDFDLRGVKEWKNALRWAVEEANKIIKKCIEVKVYWLPREEALKIPGIVKLADKLPPEIEKIRIVEIPGIDIQADGGPHVKNTCEIGELEIVKLESKGSRRRRIYYTVKP